MLIYKCTNKINGKPYIGKTVHTLDKRMRAHISNCKSSKHDSVFLRALRKYGYNNFTWEELINTNSESTLNHLEKFYIKKFNTLVPQGYNISLGGNGGDTISNHPNSKNIRTKIMLAVKDSIKKLSDKQRKQKYGGTPWNKDSTYEILLGKDKANRLKQSISKKTRGYRHTKDAINKIKQASTGRIFSKETKNKISNTEKGKIVSVETRKKQSMAAKLRWKK